MANLDKDITPVMGPTIDEKAFAPVDCHKCQAATKTEKHVDGVRGKCSTDAILCWEITVRNGRNIHSCLVVFTDGEDINVESHRDKEVEFPARVSKPFNFMGGYNFKWQELHQDQHVQGHQQFQVTSTYGVPLRCPRIC